MTGWNWCPAGWKRPEPSGPLRLGSQGTAGPVGVGPCLLAQTLQFCLGLGVAQGSERPRRPALGPAVLLLVAGVQAAHVKGAEEAPLRSSVVLHQGFQAGELSRQVLGRGQGRDSVPAPFSPQITPPTTPSPWILPHFRGIQRGHCPAPSRTTPLSLSLSPPGPGQDRGIWCANKARHLKSHACPPQPLETCDQARTPDLETVNLNASLDPL